MAGHAPRIDQTSGRSCSHRFVLMNASHNLSKWLEIDKKIVGVWLISATWQTMRYQNHPPSMPRPHRRVIGRDGHLDQSHAKYMGQALREIRSTAERGWEVLLDWTMAIENDIPRIITLNAGSKSDNYVIMHAASRENLSLLLRTILAQL